MFCMNTHLCAQGSKQPQIWMTQVWLSPLCNQINALTKLLLGKIDIQSNLAKEYKEKSFNYIIYILVEQKVLSGT